MGPKPGGGSLLLLGALALAAVAVLHASEGTAVRTNPRGRKKARRR